MTINKGGGIINKTDKIKVRCTGTYKDKHGNKRPCNKCFFVGSPGFDIFGKPKIQIVKCPRCKNYFTVTCEIEEKVIVRMLATVSEYNR